MMIVNSPWLWSRAKRTLSLALLLVAGLTLIGCGGTAETGNSTDTAPVSPDSAAPDAADPVDSTAELAAETDAEAEEYSFTVVNETESDLVALNASETQEEWGEFDLGGPLEPGESLTLVWDESTNDTNCEWWVEGVFADGDRVGPKAFDFCEAVELVFSTDEEISGSSGATGRTTEVFLDTFYGMVDTADDVALTDLSEEFSDSETIEIARDFCSAIEDGLSVDDYITEWADAPDVADLSADAQEALGSYLGVVMLAGTEVYCPRYGDEVQEWMES